ncbi:MAG: bifunctional oligoribonuclease/PAP phosphatase NrnA [Candidatus Aminicenantales bacterium]
MENETISRIANKIYESERIVITSHLRPDGDSICTSLALSFMGQQLGKVAEIINKENTPFPFNTFPDAERIKIGEIPPGKFDIAILLECANVMRSGQKNLDNYFKINIDHHYTNDHYADINWVEPQASAVGEMVYFLGEKLGIKFTKQIAQNLYAAIVSDTGSFQFSNTTARALDVCHRLIKVGADSTQVSEMLFNNNPPQKIKLLGQVLSTLRMNKKGNIAIITMFREFLESLRLKEIDTEDITTLARSIKGVHLVLFFKEVAENTFRISLRSKGKTNAAFIAEHFGGGGHPHAAGFTVRGDYGKLLEEVSTRVEELLEKIDKEKGK